MSSRTSGIGYKAESQPQQDGPIPKEWVRRYQYYVGRATCGDMKIRELEAALTQARELMTQVIEWCVFIDDGKLEKEIRAVLATQPGRETGMKRGGKDNG